MQINKISWAELRRLDAEFNRVWSEHVVQRASEGKKTVFDIIESKGGMDVCEIPDYIHFAASAAKQRLLARN